MALAVSYVLSHLLIFLSLLPFTAVAQTGGNISVGATLSADDKASAWLSPSGDFAFGFQEISSNLFLLSIWYNKIPDKTTVWYAHGGKPVPPGSTVQIASDKGLILSSPKGEELWTSDSVTGSVAYGYMNDSGNFALKDQSSLELWGSFMFPTDTMLPMQIIRRGGELTCQQTPTNFTPGRFVLSFLNSGNLVLSTKSFPSSYLNDPYYEIGTGDDTISSSGGSELVFNQSGYMYLLRINGEKLVLSEGEIVSTRDFYHRVTLNFDGVLIQYYHPKARNGSWSVLWSKPDNICIASPAQTGSGTCGYNSLCRIDANQRPQCKCPKGYSLLDPNDQYGSCKPDFPLSCGDGSQSADQDLYHLEEMQNTDWPLSDYELLRPFTEDNCRNSCLHDCLCAVSIFRSDTCWKKKLPLSNGRTDSAEPSIAFVKFGIGNSTQRTPLLPSPEPKKKNQDSWIRVGLVLLGTSVLVIFILALVICFGFFIIPSKRRARIPQIDNFMDTNLRCFTYEELAEATGGFREELGKGAFGIVYKGEMSTSCGNLVAVKKLDRMVPDGEKEFKAEVKVIGQTHHKNLVRLLGFCNEGPHRLLVYEYLGNGTLASFLFGNPKPSWFQRTEIALGIARGLLYLHEECSNQIIHCDIKPQNILLDDFFNARISDFGLAKLLMMGQSHTHTAIRGTRGYVAPEWFRNAPITVKVDVYSFGVLLLEIIACRRSVDSEISGENAILTEWAYDCYMEGNLEALVKDDMEAIYDGKKLERLIMVALWCTQEDLSLRPTMRKVTQMIEGVSEVTVPPCPFPVSTVG